MAEPPGAGKAGSLSLRAIGCSSRSVIAAFRRSAPDSTSTGGSQIAGCGTGGSRAADDPAGSGRDRLGAIVSSDVVACRAEPPSPRHLSTEHGMTPEQYRAKWGLKADYPMVAPSYAKQRQELAKIGLGRKRNPTPPPAPAPKGRRGRSRVAA
jgi:hypothetical protein